MTAKDIFSEKAQKAILEAIEKAELRTTGEIRLHVEDYSVQEPMKRAQEVFVQLEMHKTEAHNGVLFYIAVKDHKFAVFADDGICKLVPPNFWDNIVQQMQSYFINGNFVGGVLYGIEQAGHELAVFFPKTENNNNELSNDISFG